MNAYDELVEQIVREVTAELQRQSAKPIAHNSQQTTTPKVIECNIITAESLTETINGDKKVLIGSQSILTPAAKDYLRQHGVVWERTLSKQAKHIGSPRWMAVVVRSTAAATAALDRQSADWERVKSADTDEAVKSAVSSICRSDADGVVVISGQPEVIACRANRNSRIRAAVVKNVSGIKTLQQALGPNVFCIDPGERAFFEMRNLLKSIATAPRPQPPEGWTEP